MRAILLVVFLGVCLGLLWWVGASARPQGRSGEQRTSGPQVRFGKEKGRKIASKPAPRKLVVEEESPETSERPTEGGSLSNADRAPGADAAAVINRLRLQLVGYDKSSERYRVLNFLVGRLELSRDYLNPQLAPNYEGEVFGHWFAAQAKQACSLGDAWCSVLVEIGCRLEEQEEASRRVAVSAVVREFLELNAQACTSLDNDGETEGNESLSDVQQDLFFDFVSEILGLLSVQEQALFIGFLRQLHLRVDRPEERAVGK